MTNWYVTTRAATGVPSQPLGLATDPAGNVYVAGQGSSHQILKITPGGTSTVVAGSTTAGYVDGQGAAARFNQPRGLARDTAGNLYVADCANNRIRKVTPDGTVTTIAGSGAAGGADGAAMAATFTDLVGLSIDAAGNIYVVEQSPQRARKIDITAGTVTTLVTSQGNVGGCAVTPDGKTLYTANATTPGVLKIDVAAKTSVVYVSGLPGASGVTINPDNGWLYVSAYGGYKVWELSPPITPAYNGNAPVATTIAGNGSNGSADGPGGPTGTATLFQPWVVHCAPGGVLHVGEWSGKIRKIEPQGVILRDRFIAEADSNVITVNIPASARAGDQLVVRLSHATNNNIDAPQATTCSDPDMVLVSQASNATKWTLTEVWGKLAVSADAGKALTFTVPSPATARTEIYLGVYHNASTRKLFTLGPTLTGNNATPPFSYAPANQALSKPATASSTYSGLPASQAVDGSTTTRWSSELGVDPQWLQVDLGSVQTVSQIKIMWEASYAKSYQIQTSDDALAWKTIYSTTTGPGGTETLNVRGAGRYVRMYGTVRATTNGYSIWDFQVIGGPDPAVDASGLAVLLGSLSGTSIAWSATPPAGFTYRGQVNISSNAHALGVADGPPGATAKTLNWSGAGDYLTHIAVVPPKQGEASLPVTVTLTASGANAIPKPDGLPADGDAAIFTDGQTNPVWWAVDGGSVTETATVAITAGDTGSLTDGASFANPDLAPATVRFTGVEEHGALTAGAAVQLGNITANPGELLLVALYMYSSALFVSSPSVSGLGLTWTGVTQAGGNYAKLSLWWAHVSSPVSGPLTANGGSAGRNVQWSVTHYTGHNPLAPIRAYVTGTTPPVTLPSPANPQSRPIAFFATDSTTAPTVRAGWQQISLASSPFSLAAHWSPNRFDATAASTLTGNTGAYAVIAVEVPPAPTPASDTDAGTVTDDQNDPVVWWADEGSFTDDTMISVKGADTGKVTESATASQAKYNADSGVFDEAAIMRELPFLAPDRATIAESAQVQVAATAAETATVSDTAQVRAAVTGPDTGLVVDDVLALTGPPVPAADTDFAAFDDQATLFKSVHTAEDADLGTFDDKVTGGDRYLAVSDAGTGADSQKLRAFVNGADSATTADAVQLLVDGTRQYWQTGDQAAGTETSTHIALSADPDTATAVESATVDRVDLIVADDTAAGSDGDATVGMSTADAGSASDATVGVFEARREIDERESGRVRDRLSVLLKHDPLTDTAGMVTDDDGLFGDATSLFADIAPGDTTGDTGAFVEAENVLIVYGDMFDDDQAAFTEDALAQQIMASADSGVVDEAAILARADVSDRDTGTGVESAMLEARVTADDSALVGDIATDVRANVTDADTGLFAEDVVYLGVPVTPAADADFGSFDDQAVVVATEQAVTDGDFGAFDDQAAITGGADNRAGGDTGTGADDHALLVFVEGVDIGLFDDAYIAVGDTTNLALFGADTGVLTDTQGLFALLTGDDSGTFTEKDTALDAVRLVTNADIGQIGEATLVAMSTADSANVIDNSPGLFEAQRPVQAADSGRFRERLSILVMTSPNGFDIVTDDAGLVTEDAELFVELPADDLAVFADDQIVAPFSADDLGAFADDQHVGIADADSVRVVIEDAVVAEIQSPTVAQHSEDSGAFAEAPDPVIVQSDSDAGQLVDTAEPIVGLSGDDPATGTDDTVMVGLFGDDTGILSDADDPVIAMLDPDSGGFDEPPPLAGMADDDTGVLADAEELSAQLADADTGLFDDQVTESTAQVPGDDTGVFTDAEELLAQLTADDSGALVDTEELFAAPADTDTGVLPDTEELFATLDDTNTGDFTEAGAVMILNVTPTEVITEDTGAFTEDQTVTADLPADDTGTVTDTEELFAVLDDTDAGAFTDDHSLLVLAPGADDGQFTEAALLFTGDGTAVFIDDNGWFTEVATLVTYDAFVVLQDDEAGAFVETQSAYRSLDLAGYVDFRAGSMLKVNVVTRQVDLSSYFVTDEYPVGHALPVEARRKLAAFTADLNPPARFGDVLEDADFRYRYLSRWVNPDRRETGWFVVAWRRSPDGPLEWLS